MPTRPPEPGEREREEHYASGHAAYRSWCVHCIAGKGQVNPHFSEGAAGGELPEVGVDYAFLGDGARENSMPILVCRDRDFGFHGATAVPSKGRNAYALSYLVGFFRGLGRRRVVIRSDNEPALVSLIDVLAAALPETEDVLKNSPEYDHQANSLAELGARETKGQIKVLLSQLEARIGRRLRPKEPLHAWLPRHAVNCLNRFRLGPDGRSPEQRRSGRRWRRPAVEFGSGSRSSSGRRGRPGAAT